MFNKIKNLFSKKSKHQALIDAINQSASSIIVSPPELNLDGITNLYPSNYEAVKQFHEAFNHPVGDKPTPLTKERTYDRAKWTVEEIIETIYASCNTNKEFMQQCVKLSEDVSKMSQETLQKNNYEEPPADELDKIVGQVDGLVDALYFINGSFVELNIDPQPIFDIVQNANMKKLGEDGKPIIRESDGKIQKPDGWEELYAPEPLIREEIKRQIISNTINKDGYHLEFGKIDIDNSSKQD